MRLLCGTAMHELSSVISMRKVVSRRELHIRLIASHGSEGVCFCSLAATCLHYFDPPPSCPQAHHLVERYPSEPLRLLDTRHMTATASESPGKSGKGRHRCRRYRRTCEKRRSEVENIQIGALSRDPALSSSVSFGFQVSWHKSAWRSFLMEDEDEDEDEAVRKQRKSFPHLASRIRPLAQLNSHASAR